MAFRFMKRIQHSLNSRRNNRKRIHKQRPSERTTFAPTPLNSESFEELSSPSTTNEVNNLQSSTPKTQISSTSSLKDQKETPEVQQDEVSQVKKVKENHQNTEFKEKTITALQKPVIVTHHLNSQMDEHPSLKQELKKASTHQDSTIIIIYQDENHKSLSSPQIISGRRGEAINFKFKEFKHYDLINIAGFTSTFVEPYGSITLTYRRQSGANIWLFSQDIDDLHMLGKPRFVSGKVDEKYSLTPPNFIGYNLLRAQGPVKGNFNDKQQIVTYYYRDATWKEVNFNVKYLKMKVSQPGFDAPRGNGTFVTLAEGTVWQVFESVHLTNGERWHCLGGNLWIKEDYDKVRFVDSLPQYKVVPPEGYQFSIDLNVQAIIDFVPGKKLTLYDRPFGNPVDEIKDGSIVTITERQGGREMQWFKIDDRGWTIRQYLDLDIEHKVAQEQGRL